MNNPKFINYMANELSRIFLRCKRGPKLKKLLVVLVKNRKKHFLSEKIQN